MKLNATDQAPQDNDTQNALPQDAKTTLLSLRAKSALAQQDLSVLDYHEVSNKLDQVDDALSSIFKKLSFLEEISS